MATAIYINEIRCHMGFVFTQAMELEQLIHAMTLPEILQGDDQVGCVECDKNTDCMATEHISTLPKNLMIQLQRWCHNGQKNLLHVTTPEKFCFPDTESRYQLMAVIMHHGTTLHTGHYTAYVRHSHISGIWFDADDDHVKQIKPNICDAIKHAMDIRHDSTPYMLIYSAE